MLMTDNGKLIRIPTRGVSVISRNTQGVKLIGMELAEKVTSAARLAEKEEEVDESYESDESNEPGSPVESV
jgi:DNA gyrase subunit A